MTVWGGAKTFARRKKQDPAYLLICGHKSVLWRGFNRVGVASACSVIRCWAQSLHDRWGEYKYGMSRRVAQCRARLSCLLESTLPSGPCCPSAGVCARPTLSCAAPKGKYGLARCAGPEHQPGPLPAGPAPPQPGAPADSWVFKLGSHGGGQPPSAPTDYPPAQPSQQLHNAEQQQPLQQPPPYAAGQPYAYAMPAAPGSYTAAGPGPGVFIPPQPFPGIPIREPRVRGGVGSAHWGWQVEGTVGQRASGSCDHQEGPVSNAKRPACCPMDSNHEHFLCPPSAGSPAAGDGHRKL